MKFSTHARLCIAGPGLVFLLAAAAVCRAEGRDEYEAARNRMVDEDIVGAGVTNARVVQAIRATPRHEFVAPDRRGLAYCDMVLPIGSGQTISPPYVVAYMTEQLDPQPDDKILEIGTGSGYQAAVLSPLVREVYSIEIVESLGKNAAVVLGRLGCRNVHTKIGDGYQGWPEHAPFDKIIVTCSPEQVPPALVAQLREGGRMVIPVGRRYHQNLHLLKKTGGKMEVEALRPTFFVPMTGRAEQSRQVLPDPGSPRIENGDFEDVLDTAGEPAAWYYLRQLELVSGPGARSGNRYVRLSNSEPGRRCQALQGFGVDGRKVPQLEVSFWVRGEQIFPGESFRQRPMVFVVFYDENRAIVGEEAAGSWQGTFDWQRRAAVVPVPESAREAVVAIGLFGAIGKLSFDGIFVRKYTDRAGGKA